jgi:hypothetical protein
LLDPEWIAGFGKKSDQRCNRLVETTTIRPFI